MIKTIRIRSFEVGLQFRDGEFESLLAPGTYRRLPTFRNRVIRVVSKRTPWLVDDQLDVIVKSGKLPEDAHVIDLRDNERALVWIDGRFADLLSPGLYVYWDSFREVRAEVVDARAVRLDHPDLKSIVRAPKAKQLLDVCSVTRDHVGVLFIDGGFVATLGPGTYAFWKEAADARVVELDMRESQLDVAGQEIMTADKVTLRMNTIVTYAVNDPRQAVSAAVDARQSLYRDAQLALRAAIGTRDLDAFLIEKDGVAQELEQAIAKQAASLGLRVVAVGIRDVILPGDMKELMNRVTEAKKAAEANLISRREETAAMRSQANTAKMLADNPTLMRLRELEVLEKIAATGQMTVVLGEKGLADRVTNLL